MSNGDSGYEFVEEPVNWQKLIGTALTVEFGTNFTVNLRQLTDEQRDAISNDIKNDITTRIIARMESIGIPTPSEKFDVLEGLFIKYQKHMA